MCLGPESVVTNFTVDLTVLDILTYTPVAGSPLSLGVSPIRLKVEAGAAKIYVLYTAGPGAGVLVVDGRNLVVLADSGPVLPADAADLAVSPQDDLVFVASSGTATLHVLNGATLAVARDPLRFSRADANPVRVEVARDLGLVLVALDGGSQLAAFRLPSLDPLPGFPARSVPRAHTVQVDETRGMAWVGGAQRYAVVDLINPSRVTTLQMPVSCDPRTDPTCAPPRLWSMILDPVHDRTYFIDRFGWVLAVTTSNLDPAPESPGRLSGFHVLSDIAQDSRTGNLIVLGWRNLETPTGLVDRTRLIILPREMPEVGDNAVDLEVLP
jgi:hypothetical protein